MTQRDQTLAPARRAAAAPRAHCSLRVTALPGFGPPGWARPAGLAVSSNGTAAGSAIVWAIDATQSSKKGPAVLNAYDASNISNLLWSSSQALGSPDQAGVAIKYATPTIVRGKVYIGTASEVDVYGLLPVVTPVGAKLGPGQSQQLTGQRAKPVRSDGDVVDCFCHAAWFGSRKLLSDDSRSLHCSDCYHVRGSRNRASRPERRDGGNRDSNFNYRNGDGGGDS